MALIARNLKTLITNPIRYLGSGKVTLNQQTMEFSTLNTSSNQSTSKSGSAAAAASRARGEPRKLPIDLQNIPEKPKLPRNPMGIYFEHRFEELRRDNPNIKRNDVKKMIMEEWEKLEMKQPYEELSAKEQREYVNKKAVYKEFIERKITIQELLIVLDAFNKMQQQKAKEIKESKPKRPLSAYALFLKEYNDSAKSAGKEPPKMAEVAEKWKNMPESELQRYKQKAAKLKEESSEALKHWKQQNKS